MAKKKEVPAEHHRKTREPATKEQQKADKNRDDRDEAGAKQLHPGRNWTRREPMGWGK